MHILTDPQKHQHKEQLYYEVRYREGRIVNDELLLQLPSVTNNNQYKNEWAIRANNLKRFLKYLSGKFVNRQLHILDVGCGNGWMSKRLHDAGHIVAGVDLNMAELIQAERVFGQSTTLQWIYADIMQGDLSSYKYDIIVLAASCQYFKDIDFLIPQLAKYVHTGGEIHFIDSIFYTQRNITGAKQRSDKYYSELGYPQMNEYYFHHTIEDMKKNGCKKVSNGLLSRSPLQWWCFVK